MESAPRFMTPGTYPACPLPFFWEREYAAGNPYAGRHISQRGPFSVRCSLARQPSGLAKPSIPPCAMDHSPRGAGAGWLKPYCFNIDNHTSVEAPCSRAASACAITTLSLRLWDLSQQTIQRRNTIPQHRAAPNISTPTHSLK